MNILVIDNEEDIQALTQITLQREFAWTVIKAFSDEEGLVKAEIYQPDVILLDVLPDLNELDVLKRLKINEKTKSIPVILFTTQVEQSKILQFEKTEAAGLITKPFDPLTIASQIVQILARQVNFLSKNNIVSLLTLNSERN